MYTRACLVLIALITLMIVPQAFADEVPTSIEQRVRDYVSAFNERKIDTMLGMVTDSIQWLSVMGDEMAVETQGKQKLRESLEAYFKSTPSAKSELGWVQVTASRAAALENASWVSKSGPKTQGSLCVYEFEDGLISRVYYFPLEK